jgi:hypothetical protein
VPICYGTLSQSRFLGICINVGSDYYSPTAVKDFEKITAIRNKKASSSIANLWYKFITFQSVRKQFYKIKLFSNIEYIEYKDYLSDKL